MYYIIDYIMYYILSIMYHCPLHYFLFYFIIASQQYSSIQAALMVMKGLVNSGDDSEIGDSDPISSCSASSSNFKEL